MFVSMFLYKKNSNFAYISGHYCLKTRNIIPVMKGRTEIVICLGSSCFSRGNRKCLQIIEKYLKENNLEEKYFFRGSRCFNICEKGPILKIGDTIFEGVKPGEVAGILKRSLR